MMNPTIKKKKSKDDVAPSSTKTGPLRKSMRNVCMDDDDFSVAPSMEQDVKSVVSVSFDDVYKRGRKVSFGNIAFFFFQQ